MPEWPNDEESIERRNKELDELASKYKPLDIIPPSDDGRGWTMFNPSRKILSGWHLVLIRIGQNLKLNPMKCKVDKPFKIIQILSFPLANVMGFVVTKPHCTNSYLFNPDIANVDIDTLG